jgi:hypothetical protein
MAKRRKIDDGQAPMSESDSIVRGPPYAGIVRPAMGLAVSLTLEEKPTSAAQWRFRRNSDYSAHRSITSDSWSTWGHDSNIREATVPGTSIPDPGSLMI